MEETKYIIKLFVCWLWHKRWRKMRKKTTQNIWIFTHLSLRCLNKNFHCLGSNGHTIHIPWQNYSTNLQIFSFSLCICESTDANRFSKPHKRFANKQTHTKIRRIHTWRNEHTKYYDTLKWLNETYFFFLNHNACLFVS